MVHDAVGNRTSVTANLPNVPTFSGVTNYQYDTKDQLTQEQTTRGAGFTDNFGYDAAGNPTLFKGTTKTYNANNQQTATGFTHDGNGNPTTYGGAALSFDPENRLTSYGNALSAGYTGDGLRAWKQTASGRTYFLYDGTLPIIEMDASGNITATNTFGAHGLVSRRTGTQSTFYTFDAQGSVAQRIDVAGTTLSTHQFTAHGAELSTASTEPFGYGAQWGYYTDRETGLQLLTHRYYDPSVGRFLTRDPISYDGGINLYAYVENNPINYIDPFGLDTLKLPNDPSGLPAGWKPDPSHRDPNGERFRGPGGDVVDFHKGRPGMRGFRGKDHWHHNGKDDHYLPGDEIDVKARSCVLPRRPFGPTIEELNLQVESHRAMERFWGTIFWGTAGGGAILAGEMIGGPPGAAVVFKWVLQY